MTAVRQDAWSQDEDLLLAETVLRHIREGSTQLSAFEEVGRKLSRTSAACGFRWNSLVRKKYESAIALAKKQRKELNASKKTAKSEEDKEQKSTHPRPAHSENKFDKMNLSVVIQYLNQLEEEGAAGIDLYEENCRNKLLLVPGLTEMLV